MKKNTGMNAKDEKAGKTVKLPSEKAKALNNKLAEEKNAPSPTKTIDMVKKSRERKKNETTGNLIIHKPI